MRTETRASFEISGENPERSLDAGAAGRAGHQPGELVVGDRQGAI